MNVKETIRPAVKGYQLLSTKSLLILMLLVASATGFQGCKAKKLAAEKAAQEKMLIENTKNRLNALLDKNNTMTFEEKENELQDIKDLNINDTGVKALISKVEEMLSAEREQIARTELERSQRAEEERRRLEDAKNNDRLNSLDYNLENLFSQIAAAGKQGNTSEANSKIQQALKMFSSTEAMVLIIIHQEGDLKDYDEPTNIQKYLNYLKDTKQNKNVIYNIVKDGNGKIKELELIRK